ncbi:Hypothetical predicted protein [Paramuricea clavata]|uniref:Uncharacterized protein n=1 Tax=Paramuricea clavata TaxID=317549 RepID=A0A6S7K4H0_PARCT|nr:Hypothetical predicted protein [Paramuricea clavata]
MAPTFNRDLELTKRGGTSMCKLSGNDYIITTTKYDKYSKNRSVLTTHYTGNGKCEPRSKTTKLSGNRTFECRPIKHSLAEKKGIPGSDWETKDITVGCEVFILE